MRNPQALGQEKLQLGAESLAPVAQLRALVWKLMLGDPWVAWRDAARGQFLLKLTTASATKRTQAASFVARLKFDQLRVFEMIDGQAARFELGFELVQ